MSEYEFTEEQNKSIKGVAIRCLTQGSLLFLIGLFMILGIIKDFNDGQITLTVVYVIQGVCFMLMALAFFAPSTHLLLVVREMGTDITQMMLAMEKLSWGFLILVFLILTVVVCDFLGIVVVELDLP